MAQDRGQALGWDDEAQVEDSAYEVLPEGTYDYEVAGFDRGHYEGSANMAPCPMAKVRLHCTGTGGTSASGTAFVNFYLNSKTLWKITQLLKSTSVLDPETPEGQKYPLSMFSKDNLIGSTGRCKVKVTQSKRDGKTYDNNEFTFLKPEKGASSGGGLF